MSGLFDNVMFYLGSGCGSDLAELLKSHGAHQELSLIVPGTYVITTDLQYSGRNPRLSSTFIEVTPLWVYTSLSAGKRLDTKAFSPSPSMYFSGLCICVDKVPSPYREMLYGFVDALGGRTASVVDKLTTHVVAENASSPAVCFVRRHSLHTQTGLQVVSPWWLDECCKAQRRVDETPFLLLPEKDAAPTDDSHAGMSNDACTAETEDGDKLDEDPCTPVRVSVGSTISEDKPAERQLSRSLCKSESKCDASVEDQQSMANAQTLPMEGIVTDNKLTIAEGGTVVAPAQPGADEVQVHTAKTRHSCDGRSESGVNTDTVTVKSGAQTSTNGIAGGSTSASGKEKKQLMIPRGPITTNGDKEYDAKRLDNSTRFASSPKSTFGTPTSAPSANESPRHGGLLMGKRVCLCTFEFLPGVPPPEARSTDVSDLVASRTRRLETIVQRQRGLLVKWEDEASAMEALEAALQGDGSESGSIKIMVVSDRVSSVTTTASERGVRVVNTHFLESLDAKLQWPDEKILAYAPVPASDPPLKGWSVTLTNFIGFVRESLKWILHGLGADYTGFLCKRTNLLVSQSQSGQKYDCARKWGVPVVDHQWLVRCLFHWSRGALDKVDELIIQAKTTSAPVNVCTVDASETSVPVDGNTVDAVETSAPMNGNTRGSTVGSTNGSTGNTNGNTKGSTVAAPKTSAPVNGSAVDVVETSAAQQQRGSEKSPNIANREDGAMSPPQSPPQLPPQSPPPALPSSREHHPSALKPVAESDSVSSKRSREQGPSQPKSAHKAAGPARISKLDPTSPHETNPTSDSTSVRGSTSGVNGGAVVVDPPQYKPTNSAAEGASPRKRRRKEPPPNAPLPFVFVFTGWKLHSEDNIRLARVVRRLGGRALTVPTPTYHRACTHLVARSLSRTEKCLSALVSGAWVVAPKYIEECERQGKFVSEEHYCHQDDIRCEDTAPEAMALWRKARREGAPLPLANVRATYLGSSIARDIMARLIDTAGGAFIESGTHCNLMFVDNLESISRSRTLGPSRIASTSVDTLFAFIANACAVDTNFLTFVQKCRNDVC
eukprot:Rmarinus@m.18160